MRISDLITLLEERFMDHGNLKVLVRVPHPDGGFLNLPLASLSVEYPPTQVTLFLEELAQPSDPTGAVKEARASHKRISEKIATLENTIRGLAEAKASAYDDIGSYLARMGGSPQLVEICMAKAKAVRASAAAPLVDRAENPGKVAP